MQQQTDQMMAARVILKQAPVQHVRKPRQRMPIEGICSGKCPLDTFCMNARLNMLVFSDVLLIIQIDKTIAYNPAVRDKGGGN